MRYGCTVGTGTADKMSSNQTLSSLQLCLPACTCVTRVRAQAGRSRTWLSPFRETCPWPQAVAESPKTCLLPKAAGPFSRDLVTGAQARTQGRACAGGWLRCGGWIEPGELVGGPGASSSISSVLVSNPSPPAARSWPCAQGGCGRLGTSCWRVAGWCRPRDPAAEPGEAGPSRSSWRSGPWKIKRVFPLQTLGRKDRTGGREEQGRRLGLRRVSAGSDRDITITLREGRHGPQRHSEDRQADSAARGLAARQGRSGPRPLCACGLARGRRYLMRFSTEYTDM